MSIVQNEDRIKCFQALSVLNVLLIKESSSCKLVVHILPPGTILDPFMDTGDVLIAAIRLHRKFVGIEIDKQRCDHAINRIFELKNPGS